MNKSEIKGFEPIAKVMESPEGNFVVAEQNPDTNEFRVLCTGCPEMKNGRYDSAFEAATVAIHHAFGVFGKIPSRRD